MDELQRALKTNSSRIMSKGYGDGTGERGFFILDKETHELVPIEKPRKLEVDAPTVITDEISPTMSMTGSDQIHTSKSKLRQEYKDYGFIERGTARPLMKTQAEIEREKEKRRLEIRDTVARAMNDIKYGNAPIDEKSREINTREEREWQAYKKRMER